jgi:hypothetical protein
LLGISQHAIRQRVRRNTLKSVKDANDRVYVFLDQDTEISGENTDKASGGISGVDPVRMLREHNQELREQLEAERNAHAETRRIAYTLAQRIPELEAPSETRESTETAAGDVSGGEVPPEQQEPIRHRSSWWRRFFGFDTSGTG